MNGLGFPRRAMRAALLLVSLVCLAVSPASAGIITLGLDLEFSGGTPPAGSTPWVTATFTDLVGGGVQLTIAAVNLVDDEFISAFYFNFDPALDAVLFLPSPTGTGTQTDWNLISAGNDAWQADGDGVFDFRVEFPTSASRAARLTAGETFVLTIGAGNLGVTIDDFLFPSVNGPAGQTGFFAAAHIQGIGPRGEGSGWIAADDVQVPEPTSLWLLGMGLLGLGMRYAKRRV